MRVFVCICMCEYVCVCVHLFLCIHYWHFGIYTRIKLTFFHSHPHTCDTVAYVGVGTHYFCSCCFLFLHKNAGKILKFPYIFIIRCCAQQLPNDRGLSQLPAGVAPVELIHFHQYIFLCLILVCLCVRFYVCGSFLFDNPITFLLKNRVLSPQKHYIIKMLEKQKAENRKKRN